MFDANKSKELRWVEETKDAVGQDVEGARRLEWRKLCGELKEGREEKKDWGDGGVYIPWLDHNYPIGKSKREGTRFPSLTSTARAPQSSKSSWP